MVHRLAVILEVGRRRKVVAGALDVLRRHGDAHTRRTSARGARRQRREFEADTLADVYVMAMAA